MRCLECNHVHVYLEVSLTDFSGNSAISGTPLNAFYSEELLSCVWIVPS